MIIAFNVVIMFFFIEMFVNSEKISIIWVIFY